MADRITQQSVEIAVQPVVNARVTQQSVEVAYRTSARSLITTLILEAAIKPTVGKRRLKVIQI